MGKASERPARRHPGTALWIARRYLLAPSHGYATFINWVSFVGLALGVMALTVVLSVMNGFDREITGRVLRAVPHAVVLSDGGRPPDMDAVRAAAGVAHAYRYFTAQAMLSRRGAVNFLTVAGIDRAGASALEPLLSRPALTRLLERPGGIVLGGRLAVALGLTVGDPVALVLVAPAAAGVTPTVARFTLAGTFSIGANLDATLAVVLRDDVAKFGLLGAGQDGWRLHLRHPVEAPSLAAGIRAAAGPGAQVRFWMDDYGALFRAVKMEKAMMFALLALIVAIAAFNIVSGQAMLIHNKRGDVAMLATIGAGRPLLVTVFFLQGFGVAFLAVAAGLAGGVLVALNANAVLAALEGVLGTSIIAGTWFDRVPSRVMTADLAGIAALSLGLAGAAVLWPAIKAARENPADALHSA